MSCRLRGAPLTCRPARTPGVHARRGRRQPRRGGAAVEVVALSGGSLAGLPVVGALLVVLMLGLLVMARAPRLAFVGWLVGICFVPVWVGVTVKVGLESHVIASLGLIGSLIVVQVHRRGLTPARLSWGDGLFAVFLL